MAKSSVDNRAMEKVEAASMHVLRLRVELQWAIQYDVQPTIMQAMNLKEQIEEEFYFII